MTPEFLKLAEEYKEQCDAVLRARGALEVLKKERDRINDIRREHELKQGEILEKIIDCLNEGKYL